MLSPRIACVLVLVMAVVCLPAVAQISNLDFTQIGLNGSAKPVGNPTYLSLTQDGNFYSAGSAWWTTSQPVGNGFTSVFQFRISHNNQYSNLPADGIAFVIQNAASFGEGGPLSAIGGTGGDIGYGAQPGEGAPSIDNGLAIEFDTYQNAWDPNANHVAVQSCGTGSNTPEHSQICPSGQSSTLGIQSMPGINIADGNVHTVILQYDPGLLSIFVDNSGVPVLVVPVRLDQLLNLIELETGLGAYVGFTGGTGADTEEADILSWTFTPGGNTNPTTVTQMLTPGPGLNFTNYVFGSYNHKYEYSNANPGDTVSVTATPDTPNDVNQGFYNIDGSFPGAMCVTYDGTGGDCVVFHAQCSETQGSDCQNLQYTLFESYNTNQQISSPCLLKSENPNGPWTNIETGFSEIRFDPTTSGGTKGFSYFVVAQNCSAPQPAQQLTGNNCNGTYVGTYRGNLTVSNGQSCIFTGGGVTGNLTLNGGSVVLQSNSSVTGNLVMSGGSLSVTGSTVYGSLQISGPSSFAVGPNATIGGNLQIQNIPAGAGTNQVCGASVGDGNLTVQKSGVATQVGSTSSYICPGNTVSGNLTVQSNSGATSVDSNSVHGNLTDQNNAGATQVFSNTINSNLYCTGNTSITGGGNTAHAKTSQCTAF